MLYKTDWAQKNKCKDTKNSKNQRVVECFREAEFYFLGEKMIRFWAGFERISGRSWFNCLRQTVGTNNWKLSVTSDFKLCGMKGSDWSVDLREREVKQGMSHWFWNIKSEKKIAFILQKLQFADLLHHSEKERERLERKTLFNRHLTQSETPSCRSVTWCNRMRPTPVTSDCDISNV